MSSSMPLDLAAEWKSGASGGSFAAEASIAADVLQKEAPIASGALPKERRIALRIAYDGTDYAGWQRQKNGLSVQQVLEETVESLFGEQVHIVGSGRTDAGVHARGQIAAMTLTHPIPEDKLLLAMNSRLPDSIRILACREVDQDFQPRYDAKRKTYRYAIYDGPVMLPEYRRTAAHARYPLDWLLIGQMLRMLEGTHDYAAFQKVGSSAKTTIREIYKAETYPMGEPHLHAIEITGNGFLYNMVRIIAGTAIEVGSGRRPLESVQMALDTGERQYAGPTAPPQGLTLMDVQYEGRNI